jgi:hypothetical protein
MSNPEFQGYPKIPRHYRESFTITEKIDGTNGCVVITEHGEVFAQSRSRFITPDDDNMGFAQWVYENKEELLLLGPGYHYGEWWGQGIQRRYFENHKVFSLFAWWLKEEEIPKCCRVVPVIAQTVQDAKERLKTEGSIASPGFLDPEGFMVTSNLHRKILYKVILSEGSKEGSRG